MYLVLLQTVAVAAVVSSIADKRYPPGFSPLHVDARGLFHSRTHLSLMNNTHTYTHTSIGKRMEPIPSWRCCLAYKWIRVSVWTMRREGVTLCVVSLAVPISISIPIAVLICCVALPYVLCKLLVRCLSCQEHTPHTHTQREREREQRERERERCFGLAISLGGMSDRGRSLRALSLSKCFEVVGQRERERDGSKVCATQKTYGHQPPTHHLSFYLSLSLSLSLSLPRLMANPYISLSLSAL